VLRCCQFKFCGELNFLKPEERKWVWGTYLVGHFQAWQLSGTWAMLTGLDSREQIVDSRWDTIMNHCGRGILIPWLFEGIISRNHFRTTWATSLILLYCSILLHLFIPFLPAYAVFLCNVQF
jgi:hypothetical protein